MNYAKLNPEAAVGRFAAIVVDLYAGDDRLSADEDILSLLKQLESLRAGVEDVPLQRSVSLPSSLDAADKLDANDPAAARAIREAVVKLYADKPWAAAAVERCKLAWRPAPPPEITPPPERAFDERSSPDTRHLPHGPPARAGQHPLLREMILGHAP